MFPAVFRTTMKFDFEIGVEKASKVDREMIYLRLHIYLLPHPIKKKKERKKK